MKLLEEPHAEKACSKCMVLACFRRFGSVQQDHSHRNRDEASDRLY